MTEQVAERMIRLSITIGELRVIVCNFIEWIVRSRAVLHELKTHKNRCMLSASRMFNKLPCMLCASLMFINKPLCMLCASLMLINKPLCTPCAG